MKLEIVSENQTFYLWYPQNSYIDYKYEVETELLTGKVTSVTAKVIGTQTIRDNLLNRIRVVDLRKDTSVYYDLATEKANLRQNYNSLWILFFLIFVLWLFSTIFISIVYKIITFQKK